MNKILEKIIDTLLEVEEEDGFQVPNGMIWFDDIENIESDIKDSVKVNYKTGQSRIVPGELSTEFMEWFTELSTGGAEADG